MKPQAGGRDNGKITDRGQEGTRRVVRPKLEILNESVLSQKGHPVAWRLETKHRPKGAARGGRPNDRSTVPEEVA